MLKFKLNRVTIDGLTVESTYRGLTHCNSDVVVVATLPLPPDLVDQLDEGEFIRGDLAVWERQYTEWRQEYDAALEKFESWWGDILVEDARTRQEAKADGTPEPPPLSKPTFNGPDEPIPVESTRKIASLKGRYINAVIFETGSDHELIEAGKLRGEIQGTPKCVVTGAMAHLELKLKRNVERADREALADLVGHFELQASDAQLSLAIVDAFDALVQVFAPYWGERTSRDIARALATNEHRLAVVDAIIQQAEGTPAKAKFEYTLPTGSKLKLTGIGPDEPKKDDGQEALPFDPPPQVDIDEEEPTRPAFPVGLYGVLEHLKSQAGTASAVAEALKQQPNRVLQACQALLGLGYVEIVEDIDVEAGRLEPVFGATSQGGES